MDDNNKVNDEGDDVGDSGDDDDDDDIDDVMKCWHNFHEIWWTICPVLIQLLHEYINL